jgi:hypothetical protein
MNGAMFRTYDWPQGQLLTGDSEKMLWKFIHKLDGITYLSSMIDVMIQF